jgi:predicted RNA-binding protein YlqC (UPF0109 family)
MSEIDQQFIEYVVKSLVGKPEAVHIDRRIDEKGVLLELTVDPEDLGRVIGKRGATAQSLRTLIRAIGTKNDARYNLKIIDNGPLDHGRSSDDTAAPAKDQPADDSGEKANDESVADTAPEAETEAEAEPIAESKPDDESAAAEPAPAEEPEKSEPAQESSASTEDQTSDRLAKAREELADLDDLDV